MTFVEKFLSKNEPCLFGSELTSSWKARHLWQKEGKPDLEYLSKEFGTLLILIVETWTIKDEVPFLLSFKKIIILESMYGLSYKVICAVAMGYKVICAVAMGYKVICAVAMGYKIICAVATGYKVICAVAMGYKIMCCCHGLQSNMCCCHGLILCKSSLPHHLPVWAHGLKQSYVIYF